MAQIKKEKNEGIERTYGLEREFTPFVVEGIQDE